jgi:hypothetical protein
MYDINLEDIEYLLNSSRGYYNTINNRGYFLLRATLSIATLFVYGVIHIKQLVATTLKDWSMRENLTTILTYLHSMYTAYHSSNSEIA